MPHLSSSMLCSLVALCVIAASSQAATPPSWTTFSATLSSFLNKNGTITISPPVRYYTDLTNKRAATFGSSVAGVRGSSEVSAVIEFGGRRGQVVTLYPFFDRTLCYAFAEPDLELTALRVPANANMTGKVVLNGKQCDLWQHSTGSSQENITEKFYIDSSTGYPYIFENIAVSSNYFYNLTGVFSEWSSDVPSAIFQIPAGCLNTTTMPPQSNASSSLDILLSDRDSLLVNDPRRLKRISSATRTWVSGHSSRFEKMTLGDVRSLMGVRREPRPAGSLKSAAAVRSRRVAAPNKISLPTTFDARVQWPNCTAMLKIRNQQSCGGCWAFAAAESASDRFCIASNGGVNEILSEQFIIDCSSANSGCGGGFLDLAWQYLVTSGTTTEDCDSFVNQQNPTCPTTCAASSDPLPIYQMREAYSPGTNATNIMAEIYQFGPVEAGFVVFSDFMNYKSGVYQVTPLAGLMGLHAIKLIGWGTENGTDYWLAVNSWGPSWGEQGLFKIKRGVNECGIENMVAAGIPSLYSLDESAKLISGN